MNLKVTYSYLSSVIPSVSTRLNLLLELSAMVKWLMETLTLISGSI